MSDLHHYVECGLNHIYLLNAPPEGGKNGENFLSFEQDLLHEEIAKVILLTPRILRGEDMVFLRTFLGFPIKDFSRLLGVSAMVLVKWEENIRSLNKHADSCVRLACAGAFRDGELAQTVVRMLVMEQREIQPDHPDMVVFGRAGEAWRLVKQHNLPNDISVTTDNSESLPDTGLDQ